MISVKAFGLRLGLACCHHFDVKGAPDGHRVLLVIIDLLSRLNLSKAENGWIYESAPQRKLYACKLGLSYLPPLARFSQMSPLSALQTLALSKQKLRNPRPRHHRRKAQTCCARPVNAHSFGPNHRRNTDVIPTQYRCRFCPLTKGVSGSIHPQIHQQTRTFR